MPFREPNPPVGSSLQAGFLRRLLDAVRANKILPGLGYRTKYSSFGTTLEIDQAPGGAGGGVMMMALLSYHMDATHGDYLNCRPPGGASDGSDDVYVAVEPQLQSGITTKTTPDAKVWAYTAYTEAIQQRTSTSGSTVLTEYISPPFLAGDVIPVQPCSNAGVTVSGVAVSQVALTGRQWASVASS